MKRVAAIGGVSSSHADINEIQAYATGLQAISPHTVVVDDINLDALYVVVAPNDFRIHDTTHDRPFEAYSMVILRSKMRSHATLAYCLSHFCASKDIPHFNSYANYATGTKLYQAVVFHQLGLPFLKTVYAMRHDVLLQAVERELSLPFVLKDMQGAHGNSNYLIHSLDEARSALAAEPEVQFIAQEFCPNEKDYRVLVFDDEHLVFARQSSSDTHINNTSQGAKAVLAPKEVPANMLGQAHALARHMHLAVAGVDVMPHAVTGAFYFLEVNSQPQLFTGALLAEKQEYFQRFFLKQLGQAKEP